MANRQGLSLDALIRDMEAEEPDEGHSFPAAFMLRDTQVLEGKMQDRVLSLNRDFIASISPETLALIDNRSDMEVRLIERLHKDLPALGSADSGWNVTYRRELDMTNDAWLFKTREWMAARGFTRFWPEKNEEGQWVQKKHPDSRTVILPDDLPQGGEYWVSADESWYRTRGYPEQQQHFNGKERTVFYHPDDSAEKDRNGNDPNRILPEKLHCPLLCPAHLHEAKSLSPAAGSECMVPGQGRPGSRRPSFPL